MKTWMGVLIVIAAIIGPPLGVTVLGQTGGSSSVTINSVQVIPEPDGANAVVVTGGVYTVETGYSLVGITVNIMPTGGVAGEGGSGTATVNQGQFGAGIGMPGGTFDVQAMLTVMDGSGNPYYFFSDVVTGVSVPPPS